MSPQREQTKRTDPLGSEILLPPHDSEETATLSPQHISNDQVGGPSGRAEKKARTDGRNNQTKKRAAKDSKESNAAAAAAAAAGDRKSPPSPSAQENLPGSESPSFPRRVPTQRLGERANHKSSNAPNGLVASDRGAPVEDAALENIDDDESAGPSPHDASALLAVSTSSRCRPTNPPEEKHRATRPQCSSGKTLESAKPGQPPAAAAAAAAESPESALPSVDNVGMGIRGEKAAENADVESPDKLLVVDGGNNYDDKDSVDAAKDFLPPRNTRQEPAALPVEGGPNVDSPVEQKDGSSTMEAEVDHADNSSMPTNGAKDECETSHEMGAELQDDAVDDDKDPARFQPRVAVQNGEKLPSRPRRACTTKTNSGMKASLGYNSSAEENDSDGRGSPSEQELSEPKPVVVQCGGHVCSLDGNRVFLRDVKVKRAEYVEAEPKSDEKAMVVDHFLSRYLFVHSGSSKPFTEKEARTHVIKELNNYQRQPVVGAQNERVVVRCGPRANKLPGNKRYLADVNAKRAEYLNTELHSVEREAIFRHFLAHYEFIGDGCDEPITEKAVRGKLSKTLGDKRLLESPSEEPELVVVRCGPGTSNLPGNKRYVADLCAKRAEYLKMKNKPHSVEREAILRHFLARYKFVRDGSDEPITEEAARAKLMKSLADARLPAPKQSRGRPKSANRKRGRTKLEDVNGEAQVDADAHRKIKRARSSTDVQSTNGSKPSSRRQQRQSSSVGLTAPPSASDQSPGPQEEHGTAPPKPAPKKESKYLHNFLHQPYTEELAFHYYANVPEPFAENPDEPGLDPLPPPLDPPELPEGTDLKWEYVSEDRRIILADFTGVDRHQISVETKQSLGEMMQRDDIALIFQGLCEGMNEEDVLQQIKYEFSNGKPYHKFRRFDKTVSAEGSVSFVERDGFVDMPGEDFLKYLELARAASRSDATQPTDLFTFHDSKGTKQTVDPSQVVFYMTDVDIPKLLPELNDYYQEIFKMKEILPGGTWCMMNRVSTNVFKCMSELLHLQSHFSLLQFRSFSVPVILALLWAPISMSHQVRCPFVQ